MLELYQTSVGFSGLRPRIDFTIYIFFRSRKKKISVNNNLWHIWDAEILKEKHSKYSCYPSQSLLQRMDGIRNWIFKIQKRGEQGSFSGIRHRCWNKWFCLIFLTFELTSSKILLGKVYCFFGWWWMLWWVNILAKRRWALKSNAVYLHAECQQPHLQVCESKMAHSRRGSDKNHLYSQITPVLAENKSAYRTFMAGKLQNVKF